MISWFKLNRLLKKALKKSAVDFEFNPKNVKYRLMMSIDSINQVALPEKTPWFYKFSRGMRYTASVAVFFLLLSSTFAFASNSVPGDKLFGLNKLGEKMILLLPLSAQQKANVQANIVTNRFQALDHVTTDIDARKLVTVKESDESLASAIESITQTKIKFESTGNTTGAQNLEDVLDKLQAMALEREALIEKMENEALDDITKTELHDHLLQLRNTRQKAQLQIKKYQTIPMIAPDSQN